MSGYFNLTCSHVIQVLWKRSLLLLFFSCGENQYYLREWVALCVLLKYYPTTCEPGSVLQLLWSVKTCLWIQRLADKLTSSKLKLTAFAKTQSKGGEEKNIHKLTFYIYRSVPKLGKHVLYWDWHTNYSKVTLFSLSRGVHPTDSISRFSLKGNKEPVLMTEISLLLFLRRC